MKALSAPDLFSTSAEAAALPRLCLFPYLPTILSSSLLTAGLSQPSEQQPCHTLHVTLAQGFFHQRHQPVPLEFSLP